MHAWTQNQHQPLQLQFGVITGCLKTFAAK